MQSKSSIYIALAADALIAITKFAVAGISGSSAMVSEGIHSVIDCTSQLLLLWGIRKSKQKPDELRPFGYGKEMYFWSFIVSLMMFTLGGCISFYEGMLRLKRDTGLESQNWSYVVLGIAFFFTAISVWASLKVFNKQRGELSFWKAIRQTKDPAIIIVLLGDISDLAGLVVAFAGIYLSHIYHNPFYDGVASMAIGVILIITSLLLVRESRSLLMGEAINRKTLRKIIAIVESNDTIVKVKAHYSMYLAPEEVILQVVAIFRDGLETEQITTAIEKITKDIQAAYPRVKQLFIEPVAKGSN